MLAGKICTLLHDWAASKVVSRPKKGGDSVFVYGSQKGEVGKGESGGQEEDLPRERMSKGSLKGFVRSRGVEGVISLSLLSFKGTVVAFRLGTLTRRSTIVAGVTRSETGRAW